MPILLRPSARIEGVAPCSPRDGMPKSRRTDPAPFFLGKAIQGLVEVGSWFDMPRRTQEVVTLNSITPVSGSTPLQERQRWRLAG